MVETFLTYGSIPERVIRCFVLDKRHNRMFLLEASSPDAALLTEPKKRCIRNLQTESKKGYFKETE